MPGVRLYTTGRIVRRVPISGVQVVEYKEDPGVYYTISGDVIEDESLAQQAGFDVKAGRAERRRRELMAEAQKKIDEQVAKEEAAVEKQLEEEETKRGGGETQPPEVHLQPGADLRAVHRGAGKYRVEDSTGSVIADGLSKKDADQFISDAAAAQEEEAAAGG